MAQKTSRFVTSGLHCSSCSMLVDMTLTDLAGVESTKTDHATGLTVVTYDDAVVTPEAIISAIQGAGYEADLEA